MRVSFWVLIALFFGAFLAHFLIEDRGYVLINFRGYLLEMSVPGLLLVLIAAYFAVRAAAAMLRAPRKLGGALAERRIRRAGSKLTRGLVHMAEGDWARSERLLTQGMKGSDAPLVNYLLAARAAQLQGSRERRDEWLKIAFEEQPHAEKAVLLTQAELQLEDGEYERALATLKRIQETHANHPIALALTARAYSALGDKKQLAALLPRLGGAKLDPQALEDIAVEALQEVIASPELTHEELERRWAELPVQVRKLPRLAVLHAIALDRLGRGKEAERELRTSLKRRWQAPLVAAYGQVHGDDLAKQLRQAESWLLEHSEDAVLLLAAARLSMANELWGKARSYLESSLAIDPAPAAYALYGRLLDQLGENERAALAFRSGLALVDGADPVLPALAPPAPPIPGSGTSG